MNTLPTGHRASSLSSASAQYHISDMRIDNSSSHNVRGDSNTNVGNVSHSYNNIINVGVSEESLRIQAWLSPLEPHRRHQDVSNLRLDGVGDWVLEKSEFESWRKGRDGSVNPTLLCYGSQGVGKTYLSSLVIDTLCKRARGQNMAVLSLYCDYQAQKDQTAVNMIGGLLKQVAIRETEIPGEIRSAFKGSRKDGGKSLRLPEMRALFIKSISSFERVYICFDAVDELLPQHRSEFLRTLRQIMGEAPNLRLFLTGRPYMRKELDKYLTNGAYIIHVVADQGDIARYISRMMDEDGARDPDLMTENLKNDIMKTVPEKSSEMFLLIALNIDAILGQTSLSKRKELLKRVATTGVDLDTVYAQTLQRIREQKGDRSRLGIEVLMWVSHARRPLRVDELRHALAVEIGKRDLDPDNIRPQDTVLGSCLGLAVVDSETSTVRLIHYTLQEYLSRPSILPGAHKLLSETCLAYLNYKQVRRLPPRTGPNLERLPFLEYSSLYWGIHAKAECSGCAKSLALKLLNIFNAHISATLLFNHIALYHYCSFPNHLFPGLHAACYFGIVEVVLALIEVRGCDINQGDCAGSTPLMWAARQGNEEVVKLLLSRDDVSPGKPNKYYETPLWMASQKGHEGVVRLLLSRDDVNPDQASCSEETPLWTASDNGHEGVVRLLLAQDGVNPNKLNCDIETPLSMASYWGHEGIVRLLLARDDVDPDQHSNCGETPLWAASYQGHEVVVRLLLTRDDLTPDKPNDDGKTPLWAASRNGHEGVVRLLLTRGDVNPNKPDNRGRTPLHMASKYRRTKIIALLQHRESTSPGLG